VFIIVAVLVGGLCLLGLILLLALLDGGSQQETQRSAMMCPDRIAEQLPDPGTADLVAAYHTKNKQIILCRTNSGTLYYYGEFIGRPETGLVMPAEETSVGYVARNGPYAYEVRGNEVIITKNGKRIGKEVLTPQPSPS
jgi:hypothetical protein